MGEFAEALFDVTRFDPSVDPYLPTLPARMDVSPAAHAHYGDNLWRLIQENPILVPMRMKLLNRLYGPIEALTVSQEDSDWNKFVLMQAAEKMLRTAGFTMDLSGLLGCLPGGGDYFNSFSTAAIYDMVVNLHDSLSHLVGAERPAIIELPAAPVVPPTYVPETDPSFTTPIPRHSRDAQGDVIMRTAGSSGVPSRRSRVGFTPVPEEQATQPPGATVMPVRGRSDHVADRAQPPQRQKTRNEDPSTSHQRSRPQDESDEMEVNYDPARGNGSQIMRLRTAVSSEIKKFSGKDHDEIRARSWLEKISRAGIRDQLSDVEVRELFQDSLTRPALNWYKQLPIYVRGNWTSLSRAFKEQYCEEGFHRPERYYNAIRGQSEDPLDYFYRLNVAAKYAKIPVHNGTPIQQRQHISRFLKSLADPDLTRHLAMMDLVSVTALEDTLIALRRSAKQDRVPDPTPTRPKTPPTTTPKRVNVLKATAETTDSGTDEQEVTTSDEEQAYPSVNVVQGNASPRGSRDPCAKCQSTQHHESKCWADIVCGLCNFKGHPTDRCRRACKGCGEVHERGECQLAAIAEKLLTWYKPAQHAGLLTPDLEKLLGN